MKSEKGDYMTWQQKLGKIWARLNYGIKIENLSTIEQEILFTEYGNDWKQIVNQKLVGPN